MCVLSAELVLNLVLNSSSYVAKKQEVLVETRINLVYAAVHVPAGILYTWVYTDPNGQKIGF